MFYLIYLVYLILLLSIGIVVLEITLWAAVGLFLGLTGVSIVLPFIDAAAASYRRFGGAAPIGGLGLEPPEEGTGKDPAVRGYLFGPAYRETLYVAEEALAAGSRRFRTFLSWIATKVRDRRELRGWRWTNVIVGLAMQGGVVAGGLFGLVMLAAVVVVFATYLVAAGGVATLTSGVLLVVERGLLWARGITVECPNCHSRVTRPMYRCSGENGCGALHRALVPGTRGVFQRICRCGRSLPTTLLLGKGKLTSQCSQCPEQAELPIEARTAPTAHLPVVGGPQVGKSVLMMSAVRQLYTEWSGAGSANHFWGSSTSADALRRAEDGLRDPSRMRKTDANRQPLAFTIYLTSAGRRWLVYLYDTAGEIYTSLNSLADTTFFGWPRGVIICIDPFALNLIRRQANPDTVKAVRSLPRDPKVSLDLLVQNLRENRRALKGGRVGMRAAVVVTKGDAFPGAGVPSPYDGRASSTRAERDAAVRDWIEVTAGRPDIVATVEQGFDQVGWYVTGHEGERDERARDERARDGGRLDGGVPDGGVPDGGVLDASTTPVLWALTGERRL